MRTGYRNTDSRVPFFWESSAQPPARWHGEGEGPCQYLADTPDGAWAEFLRHEEITDPDDLDGIARSLWAIEVPDRVLDDAHRASGPDMAGGLSSYRSCQDYARSHRANGISALRAPSAALVDGGADGEVTDGGLREGSPRTGEVWVLYGRRPELRGYRVVERGSPPARVLDRVRPLTG